MSKKQDPAPFSNQTSGTLVERARIAAVHNAPSGLCPLLNELAGEVERLWQVERQLSMVEADAIEARLRYSNRVACLEVEREAEIERIKSTVDTEAIQKAYYRGYVACAKQMNPMITTMLMVDGHGH